MAKASQSEREGALLDAIAKAVGAKGLVTDPGEMAPHLVELRGRYRGAARALVKPASTAEVAAVVQLAAAAYVADDGSLFFGGLSEVVPDNGTLGLFVSYDFADSTTLIGGEAFRAAVLAAADLTLTTQASGAPIVATGLPQTGGTLTALASPQVTVSQGAGAPSASPSSRLSRV